MSPTIAPSWSPDSDSVRVVSSVARGRVLASACSGREAGTGRGRAWPTRVALPRAAAVIASDPFDRGRVGHARGQGIQATAVQIPGEFERHRSSAVRRGPH
jgi:hypothetical protein